ncbi:MAG TPA: VOC family protein [Thermomicrobiales bacterium]|nr:VOC family protein [Thermomicrobiales bacterium]
MAYRFVLDLPDATHPDAKAVIDSVRDAQVLIDRHPRAANPDEARAELTVAAHSLDVIDALYAWLAERDINRDVYLHAFKGQRIHMPEHDARTLRRMIQGDQYWFENTVPRIHYVDQALMEGGARVADVPFGGRSATGTAVLPAETRVDLGSVDHVAIRVRDMRRAEEFYCDFFGMSIIYRAYRDIDRWQHLDASFDWRASYATGVKPEIVRLENGSIAVVLIDVGGGAVMHEQRVAYVSVSVPLDTLNALRGRVLFSSYTLQEDSSHAFRFVDPFGMSWQLVAGS